MRCTTFSLYVDAYLTYLTSSIAAAVKLTRGSGEGANNVSEKRRAFMQIEIAVDHSGGAMVRVDLEKILFKMRTTHQVNVMVLVPGVQSADKYDATKR